MAWVWRTLLVLWSVGLALGPWGDGLALQVAPSDVVAELRTSNLYVAAGANSTVSAVQRAELLRYTQSAAVRGYPLKIAVIDRPPQGFRTLGQFVEAAHSTLDLGDGILIGVAMDAGNGSGSVSARTGALDDATTARLQQAVIGAFTASTYSDGIIRLADAIIDEIEAHRSGATLARLAVIAMLLATVVVVTTFWLFARARSWKTEMASVSARRDALYPMLRRLDDDLPFVRDQEGAQQASEEHVGGSEHYLRASQLVDDLADIAALRAALPGAHWVQLREARNELTESDTHLKAATEALDRAYAAADR